MTMLAGLVRRKVRRVCRAEASQKLTLQLLMKSPSFMDNIIKNLCTYTALRLNCISRKKEHFENSIDTGYSKIILCLKKLKKGSLGEKEKI